MSTSTTSLSAPRAYRRRVLTVGAGTLLLIKDAVSADVASHAGADPRLFPSATATATVPASFVGAA
ncbi:hypothetical protein ACIQWR_09470 [Streptomyces sp. NPDC098789]|uniref:hypothetical protein n=1 Tax=Streptomyces sp. NPDC098789 TaxID=3366098 RepID=UPI003827F489